MTHSDEKPFEIALADWFAERYGEGSVKTQVYQPEPRWYCDIIVDTGYATLFVECESRAGEVRHGIAQALGYAAADRRKGVPMVVTPAGHLTDAKVQRLQQSTTVVVREFDAELMEFVG